MKKISLSLFNDMNHINSYDELRGEEIDKKKVESVLTLFLIDLLNFHLNDDYSLFENIKVNNTNIKSISVKLVEQDSSNVKWYVKNSTLEILLHDNFLSLSSVFYIIIDLPIIITDFLYLHSNLPNYHIFVLNKELEILIERAILNFKGNIHRESGGTIDENTPFKIVENYKNLSEFIDNIQDFVEIIIVGEEISSLGLEGGQEIDSQELGREYFRIKKDGDEELIEKDINGFAIPRSDEASPAEEIYTITRTIRLLGGQYENY